jgi:hypothetical protein
LFKQAVNPVLPSSAALVAHEAHHLLFGRSFTERIGTVGALSQPIVTPQRSFHLRCRSFDVHLVARIGLYQAHLSGADLSRAYLSGARLINPDLSRAYLINADLHGATLLLAYLTDAHLINADLSNADLSGANLNDANLYGANMSGANMSTATISQAQLDRACGAEAKLPPGLKLPPCPGQVPPPAAGQGTEPRGK